jgi:hypothetical protein
MMAIPQANSQKQNSDKAYQTSSLKCRAEVIFCQMILTKIPTSRISCGVLID